MKNILKITTVLLLTISLFSCSKDDSTPEKKYLLEKYSSSTTGLIQKFTFNSQNQLSSIENYQNNTIQNVGYITYNNDNKIDRLTFSDHYVKITYNSDGKVEKYTNYTINPNLTETLSSSSEFSYSTNKITNLNRDETNTLTSKQEVIYNSEGNITEIKNYSVDVQNPNGLYTGSKFYSNYDDKKNLVSSLPSEIFIGFVSKNNARTYTNSNNTTTNYLFEYNEAGYLTKKSEIGTTSSETYEYLIK